MIWVLWTAGIGVGIIAVTIMIMLWWEAATRRRAEKLRVTEYLAKLTE